MLTCQAAYVVHADRKNWPTVHKVGRIIWQVGIDDQRLYVIPLEDPKVL